MFVCFLLSFFFFVKQCLLQVDKIHIDWFDWHQGLWPVNKTSPSPGLTPGHGYSPMVISFFFFCLKKKTVNIWMAFQNRTYDPDFFFFGHMDGWTSMCFHKVEFQIKSSQLRFIFGFESSIQLFKEKLHSLGFLFTCIALLNWSTLLGMGMWSFNDAS